MKTKRNYSKVLLGYNNGEPIYLSPPSWDCDWYWGFGYLGNDNCHYHLSGISEGKDLHSGLINHFGKSLIIRPSDLWTFAELIKSFYKLKEAAEILKIGSAGYSSNPCKEIIKNTEENERINNIVLPVVFDEIYKILDRNKKNDKIFRELVLIDNEEETSKVIDFMKKNSINPDDLKIIPGLIQNDRSRIHSHYWADFHKNKINETKNL